MSTEPTIAPPLSAVTLFTEDLATSAAFYGDVLGLEPVFVDSDSVVFRFGGVLINLLRDAAVPELIEPAHAAPSSAGVRSVLTVQVDAVDEWLVGPRTRGLQLVNGPIDRPWGPRTACFADPSGHHWEVASSG